MIIEMFPQEYIDLNKELATGLHKPLYPILMQCSPDDLDLRIAHIAAYCEVALDDTYTLEDRMRLCAILTRKLMEKRVRPDVPEIILAPSSIQLQ